LRNEAARANLLIGKDKEVIMPESNRGASPKYQQLTGLIVQRTAFDCGICCLAMLFGVTYEAALHAAGDSFVDGKGLYSERDALKQLGYAENDFIITRRDWCIAPEAYRRLSWRRRALITVPSLNREGVWHMVYYDGNRLFDPHREKRYESWEQLMPEEITLFAESAAGQAA
jgi:hypothetical protein